MGDGVDGVWNAGICVQRPGKPNLMYHEPRGCLPRPRPSTLELFPVETPMMSSSLAFFFSALISSSSASAPIADVFVDINAANCASGTGTLTDPVCSIVAAIALAAAGDTIHIAPGVYTEGLDLSKDLELIGTGGSSVTFVGGAPLWSITVGASVTASIDGLTTYSSAGSLFVNTGGDVTLRNSTITGSDLAGVHSVGATVAIESCMISSNDYSGVYARGTDLTIVDTTITNNDGLKGGGIFTFGGSFVMTGSTVSYNHASIRGGGLYLDGTDFQITNSTISKNRSAAIGGIAFYGGPPTKRLTNVTVVGNIGGYTRPPGIYGEAHALLVSHSIVAANRGIAFTSVFDAAGTISFTDHNVVGALPWGGPNASNGNLLGTLSNPARALIGPLRDNGGPTKTHALLFGSPGVDGGDLATAALLDQRGFARSSGTAPDIGAYEFDIGEVSLCSGDGGDQLGCTNCPCGNNAALRTVGGCLNSAGTSAVLSASGSLSASVPPMSTHDLRMSLSGLPALKFSLLTSGAAVAPTNGGNPCFGLSSGLQSIDRDGLRCAVMSLKRHGGRSADMQGEIMDSTGPSRVWGGEAQPHGGLWKQGGFASGQTRYFQAIYREHPTLGCMRGLNTSQAVEVTFRP